MSTPTPPGWTPNHVTAQQPPAGAWPITPPAAPRRRGATAAGHLIIASAALLLVPTTLLVVHPMSEASASGAWTLVLVAAAVLSCGAAVAGAIMRLTGQADGRVLFAWASLAANVICGVPLLQGLVALRNWGALTGGASALFPLLSMFAGAVLLTLALMVLLSLLALVAMLVATFRDLRVFHGATLAELLSEAQPGR